MNPKKCNLIYTEVSEDLDISKNLVENLVEFYYKNVRTLLSDLYHPRINITGLGVFKAKGYVVEKSIPRLKKYLVSHDTSTFAAYYNKKMLEEKISLLESLDIQIKKEKERKEEFLKNKKNVKSKKNLEK